MLSSIPAYVDGATAATARGGLLSLRLGEGKQLSLRIVATGERFPTTHGRFAVLDRASLAAAMDELTPGAGTATEVWVWAPAGDSDCGPCREGSALAPFDRVAVDSRPDDEQSLRSDPVALTSSRLLLGTALVGVLVGGLCVVLMILAERRESAGELFAREADGTRPGRLRVELLARAGAVLAVGVPVGVAAGIVLAQATTTLVTVTAGGTTPEPPLVDAGLLSSWLRWSSCSAGPARRGSALRPPPLRARCPSPGHGPAMTLAVGGARPLLPQRGLAKTPAAVRGLEPAGRAG